MSVAEQYLNATVSENLRVQDHSCDADKLIAAGWVASASDRKALSLSMHRWLSGDTRGAGRVVDVMAGWVKGRSRRPEWLSSHRPMTMVEAVDLARAVTAWWRHQACPVCHGHGHPTIPGAPVLNEDEDCGACGGTGKRSLEAGMTEPQALMARWLASELEGAAPAVFGEVARRLRADLDL